jgi:3-oxoacyl-[acyl-carrier protein] reductase
VTDQQPLAGQVALVTGGTRGLGLGIATRLLAEGASVAVIGRDGARAERVAAQLQVGANESGRADPAPTADGARVVGIAADVSDWDQAQAAVAAVSGDLGSPDIVIANAGVGVIGTVDESDPADWRAMMEANYLGTAHIVKAALPAMLERGRGDIVAIASAGGTRGYPEWSGYCASKWAVVGFMECLAQEVNQAGVRVCTLCPGGVDTPFWDDLNKDVHRQGTTTRASLMSPDDVAETVMLQLRLPRSVVLKRALFFPTSEWH